ncbi:MAG: DUF502 domain-containing protein [candidate division Zixibacteria bacterium]|nr:DUF502 domain-containing protein [candidate division Zixibacteria bacterium]
MAFKDTITKILRNYFLSGVLIIVPLIITYLVLRFLFLNVDGLLSPLINRLIGYKIPGIGFVATLVLIFLAGIFASSLIFSRLVSYAESFFLKIPLVRTIYSPAKQLVESLTIENKRAFKLVVLIQFPRSGIFTLGFVTKKVYLKEEEFLAVFVPSTPTPFTGWTLMFKEDEVIPLDITVEQGIEFFVSGGIASPDKFPIKEKLVI